MLASVSGEGIMSDKKDRSIQYRAKQRAKLEGSVKHTSRNKRTHQFKPPTETSGGAFEAQPQRDFELEQVSDGESDEFILDAIEAGSKQAPLRPDFCRDFFGEFDCHSMERLAKLLLQVPFSERIGLPKAPTGLWMDENPAESVGNSRSENQEEPISLTCFELSTLLDSRNPSQPQEPCDGSLDWMDAFFET
eukprot:Sdes_comp19592_c0_seq1m11309